MEIDHVWAELGILPTQEQAAIRRAYAARLKSIRPDADPQGFAKLRQAYERALGTSTRAATRPMMAAPQPSMQTRPEPLVVTPTTPAAKPLPEPQAKPVIVAPTEDGVSQGLRGGDVVAAADWLVTARERGALSLQQDMRLADTLAWSMAEDRSLSGEAVLDAADRLGWRIIDQAGPWASALRARLEAEQWLLGLRRDAASFTWLFGEARGFAARTLLGQGPTYRLTCLGPHRALRRLYGEYLLHAAVIGHRFDPVRLEVVGKSLVVSKRQAVFRRWREGLWYYLRRTVVGVVIGALLLLAMIFLAVAANHFAGRIEQSWHVPMPALIVTFTIVSLLVQRGQ